MKTQSEKYLNDAIAKYNIHWRSEIKFLEDPINAERNGLFSYIKLVKA